MTTTRPGWYPDPTGRFPHRWHDGNDWTASIVDHSGQQGYDALPPVGAPAVPAVVPPPPTPASTPVPPPPPGAAPTPTPAVQSMWQPAPPSRPTESTQSWQPGQPWQPSPTQRPGDQAYGQTTTSGWQPAPTSASLGWTGSSAVATPRRGANPVVVGLVAAAVVLIVLSMFVLDWVSVAGGSVGYRDVFEGNASAEPFLDELTIWHFKWLGFVVAGGALLAVVTFVIGRVGSHRAGHVMAALAASIGAVLSTFAIVRTFRGAGPDPEFGAWLLPAGYLVLLVAVAISARRDA